MGSFAALSMTTSFLSLTRSILPSLIEILPQETGLFTDAYNERFLIEDQMVIHITVHIFDSTAEVDQQTPSVSLEESRDFKALTPNSNGTSFALSNGYVGVSNG